MITMERDLVENIRANPFGADRPISNNEREALERAEQLACGNLLMLRAFEQHVEREIARETR